MGSHFSNNLRILVAKEETTAGKAVTFDADDFDVRVWEPTITPTIEVDDEASKCATGDHGECESIMGAQSATIDFSVKMNSCADAATEPTWLKFAKACGCKVISAVQGFVLCPRKSEDITTITIRVYDVPRNGNDPAACFEFAGCMGNMTIGAEGVGKPWTATFSFTGKLVNVRKLDSGEVIPTFTAENTPIAEKLLNYSLNFNDLDGVSGDDSSQKISTFLLDVGNEISPLIDQGDPTGYAYYSITKRSPRFSCNPLMNGSFDKLYGAWKGGNTFGVELLPKTESTAPPTHGFTLLIPRAQQLTAAVANREGLVNWDLNLKALRNDNPVPNTPTDSVEDTWKLIVGTSAS